MSDFWLQTYTGSRFDYQEPAEDQIHISDIAHALSLICRFGGHIPRFYPVALHCIHVSRLVPPEQALAALMHDAAEAYIGDMPRGLKLLPIFEGYRVLEKQVEALICARFGLGPLNSPEIKKADHVALATEKRDLLPHAPDGFWTQVPSDLTHKIEATTPRAAEIAFIERYEELRVLASQTSLF